MSYSVGYGTTQDGAIEVIKNFAAANGWTINQHIAKGTGYLLNLYKLSSAGTPIYANLRSSNNESFPASMPTKVTGIQSSLSTGYDAGVDFYNQPGAITETIDNTRYYALNSGAVSSIAGYHLFGFANPDMIGCVLQLPNGQHKHIVVGDVVKKTAFNGGQFIFSSNGLKNTIETGLPFEHLDNTTSTSTLHNTGILRCDIDNRDGWWGSCSSQQGVVAYPNLTGAIAGSLFLDYLLLNHSKNLFSGAGMLAPVNLYAHITSSNKFKPIGYIDWMRVCRFTGVPGQILSIGSDDWMVFPSTTASGTYGIAYRYIP